MSRHDKQLKKNRIRALSKLLRGLRDEKFPLRPDAAAESDALSSDGTNPPPRN